MPQPTSMPIRLEPLQMPRRLNRTAPLDSMSSSSTATRSTANGADSAVVDRGYRFTVAGNANKPQGLNADSSFVVAGTGASGQPFNSGQIKYFDFNMHSIKKAVSSALLDIALLLANASELKTVLLLKERHPFYALMVALLVVSIISQIVIGVLLIILSKININEADDKKHKLAETLNTAVVISVFVLTVVNVFISAIGISSADIAVVAEVNEAERWSG